MKTACGSNFCSAGPAWTKNPMTAPISPDKCRADPTGPTCAIGSADPINPADSVNPTDPVNPIDATDTAYASRIYLRQMLSSIVLQQDSRTLTRSAFHLPPRLLP